MKVLLVMDNIAVANGISSIVMNFCRSLKNIRFDFIVSTKYADNYEAEIISLGGKVFYMTDAPSLSVSALPQIIKNAKRFMKANAGNYDVVHLHTATFCFPYLYYAKKYGVKSRVAHAHSISFGNSKLSSVRNTLMLLPLKTLANKFLACSQTAGEKFYYPLKIKDFEVMLNGISFEKYAFDLNARRDIREEFGVGEKTVLVGHISNMTPLKNVPFAVKSFAKLHKVNPDSRLLLIGKNELPEAVKSAIDECGVGEWVINAGVRSDVPRCLSAMDVCLMPSETEGLGLVAVECQASMLPVITSKGFPDEIYATDICCALDYDEQLWADKALELSAGRLQPIDLKAAKERFDIEYVARKLADCYVSQKGDIK